MDAPTAPIPLALAPLPSSNRVLPPPQVPLHVGFVGTGLIGKATLKQVGAHAPSLLATGGLDLRIAACADSKHMILASSADGMNPDAVDAAVGDRAVAEWDAGALAAETPVAADLDALVAKIVAFARADPDAAAVIVDNTSSDAVADRYGEWLARGVHVVTPNKKANSGDLARFRRFRASADESGAKWLYEGTIGAGLPVVSTLRTLRASGDRFEARNEADAQPAAVEQLRQAAEAWSATTPCPYGAKPGGCHKFVADGCEAYPFPGL